MSSLTSTRPTSSIGVRPPQVCAALTHYVSSNGPFPRRPASPTPSTLSLVAAGSRRHSPPSSL
eukprot:1319511-Pleurochrysis_carterae.AAC.1